jgi:hypothetical protein
MIESGERMIIEQQKNNQAANNLLNCRLKMLQNVPREEDKFERLLNSKER